MPLFGCVWQWRIWWQGALAGGGEENLYPPPLELELVKYGQYWLGL